MEHLSYIITVDSPCMPQGCKNSHDWFSGKAWHPNLALVYGVYFVIISYLQHYLF